MSCNEAISTLPVSRPLTERIAGDALDAFRSAAVAVAALWPGPASPRRDERSYAPIADLNEHTLKDIGAPHWLVARAAERREAQRLRWLEFEVR